MNAYDEFAKTMRTVFRLEIIGLIITLLVKGV